MSGGNDGIGILRRAAAIETATATPDGAEMTTTTIVQRGNLPDETGAAHPVTDIRDDGSTMTTMTIDITEIETIKIASAVAIETVTATETETGVTDTETTSGTAARDTRRKSRAGTDEIAIGTVAVTGIVTHIGDGGMMIGD